MCSREDGERVCVGRNLYMYVMTNVIHGVECAEHVRHQSRRHVGRMWLGHLDGLRKRLHARVALVRRELQEDCRRTALEACAVCIAPMAHIPIQRVDDQ